MGEIIEKSQWWVERKGDRAVIVTKVTGTTVKYVNTLNGRTVESTRKGFVQRFQRKERSR